VSSPHLARRFAECAARTPDDVFLVEGARHLTWGEVAERSGALARAFRAEGLQPGDRLAIDLSNGIEWVVSLLAAAEAQLVVIPLDPGLGYHELKYQLRHADVAGAVIPESPVPFDWLELFDELLPELPALHLLAYAGPGVRWFDDRAIPFEELVARGRRAAPLEPRHDGGDTLALLYTSGTMGKPKGVMLTHAAMLGNADATATATGLAVGGCTLMALPLFHVFGLSALLIAISAGHRLVLLPTFSSAAAIDAIAEGGVTFLPGTPTIFELMMRDPSFTPEAVRSVTGGVVGGSVVAPSLVDRIRAWCDVEVGYGLTEAGPTVTMTSRADAPAVRRGTVGRPLPGVEVAVVDLMSGVFHGREAVGELAVRSSHLMAGYHRMPVESSRVLTPEGWLLTGDLAHLDEDGVVTLVARRKELIVRAGQSVTPREIEDVLRTHPGVEDACVVGTPHDVLGELIIACVVPVEGAVVTGEELRRFCQDTLAATKVPDVVRFFDTFPLTASGKVKRQEIARVVAL
jgi:fatty-acyl-CoA synthase